MDRVISEANAWLRQVLLTGLPDALKPARMWEDVLDTRHRKLIAEARSVASVIETVTENVGYFTKPTRTDDPVFAAVADGYARHLDRLGFPLDDLDPFLHESPMASRNVAYTHAGRRLSTAFLYYLSAALTATRHAGAAKATLEIGGGYGGLARILKILDPGRAITLVDMPESLWFAYVFLRSSFPDATFVCVTPESASRADAANFDFMLVPTNALSVLSGRRFDLAFNSQSLSEMRTETYDCFMELLQDRTDTRWFYNLNRFGRHEDGLSIPERLEPAWGDDVVFLASDLDSHWKLRHWALSPAEGNAGMADPRYMPVLEIVVERIPPVLRNRESYALVGDGLFARAKSRLRADSQFHRLMWDAIRLSPTRDKLEFYVDILDRLGFREAAHYARLRDRLGAASE